MAAPSPNRPADDELRSLYVDQRWTAQQIADRAQVQKITALRWLRAAGIERRASGNTLANRGKDAPSAADLQRMVHEEHLSYVQIGERYEVDPTAVPYWLDAHGIKRPDPWTTRRGGRVASEPDEAELRERLGSGESLRSIERDFDVSRTCLRQRCMDYGITVPGAGWQAGRKFDGVDGHALRSTYEQRVCDWLYRREIEHYVEPAYPWDRRYHADFRIGSTFVEVWGVTNNAAYERRKAMKIKRCAEEGVPLVEINHWQFANGRKWWRALERVAGDVL